MLFIEESSTMSSGTSDGLTSTAQLLLSLISDGAAHSRADLARITGKAPSTISIYINELLEHNLVEEAGETASTGGRKGRRLQLANDTYYYIAASLLVDAFRLTLAGPQGSLGLLQEITFPPDTPTEELFTKICRHIQKYLATSPTSGTLAGVCLGVPAPVDTANGCVHSSARIPQWNNFPLAQRLSTTLGVPVILENDANLIALAEDSQGALGNDSITLIAGRGIGVGIIINGAIHQGATGNAGDISHVRHTTYGDKLCPCGNRGCLTTVASLDALTEKWAENGGTLSHQAFLKAAQLSDPVATNILRQAGEQLGIALATVISFFNPSTVYLSGPLAQVDVFVSAIRTCIYGSCHPLQTKDLKIARGELGQNAALYGAAVLARQKIIPGQHPTGLK